MEIERMSRHDPIQSMDEYRVLARDLAGSFPPEEGDAFPGQREIQRVLYRIAEGDTWPPAAGQAAEAAMDKVTTWAHVAAWAHEDGGARSRWEAWATRAARMLPAYRRGGAAAEAYVLGTP